MRFTKSKWSHTAFAVRFGEKVFIIDAQKDGLNLRPCEAWHAKYQYEILVCRSYKSNYKHSRSYLLDRAMGKIGVTAYDFQSLLIRQPWEIITGKWKNKGEKEDDRFVCSEFVAWTYSIEEWYKMSPEDVYQWCEQNGFEIITKNF